LESTHPERGMKEDRIFPYFGPLGPFETLLPCSRSDFLRTDEGGMGKKDGFEEVREGDWISFQPETLGRKALGVLFLLLSLGIGYLFVTGKFHDPHGKVASPWGAMIPGFLVGLPGLGLFLFRSGIRVNAKERLIQSWWGFVGPWRMREESLTSFSHVEVLKEVRRSGNQTVIHYPVRLVGEGKALRFVTAQEPLRARRLSERFASAVAMPLHNHLSGIPVIRTPEEFDRSLGENIIASGELPQLPPQPADSKVALQVEGDSLQVEIPAPGLLRGGGALLLLLFPFSALSIGLFFTFMKDFPQSVRLVFLGIAIVPLMGAFAYALARGVRREILEVGPKEIVVRSCYPWMERSKSLLTREVEEMTQTDGNKNASPLAGLLAIGGVTLMADENVLSFGASLSKEDRRFLIDLVRYVLARSVAKNPPPKKKTTGVALFRPILRSFSG